MKKEIPFFSSLKVASPGYEKFYYVKSYLNQKDKMSSLRRHIPTEVTYDLAEKVGYKKINKFIIHKEEWHQLIRKVPLSYLDAIDVDREVLQFALELDVEAFEEELEKPFDPKIATVRYMATIYGSLELPDGVNEKEAVEYLKEYCAKEKRMGFIAFGDVKKTWVREDGSSFDSFERPELKFTKHFMIPSGLGLRSGASYIR